MLKKPSTITKDTTEFKNLLKEIKEVDARTYVEKRFIAGFENYLFSKGICPIGLRFTAEAYPALSKMNPIAVKSELWTKAFKDMFTGWGIYNNDNMLFTIDDQPVVACYISVFDNKINCIDLVIPHDYNEVIPTAMRRFLS